MYDGCVDFEFGHDYHNVKHSITTKVFLRQFYNTQEAPVTRDVVVVVYVDGK